MIAIVTSLRTIIEVFNKEKKAFEHLKGILAFKAHSSYKLVWGFFLLFFLRVLSGFFLFFPRF